MSTTTERESIIRAVQNYCADVLQSERGWTPEDGVHIAELLNGDNDPFLRQMRNTVGSGLLEHLR